MGGREGKAGEVFLKGDLINAEEALRIGLVNKVVEPEQLVEEATNMAKKDCKQCPIAVKARKDAINKGMQMDIDK